MPRPVLDLSLRNKVRDCCLTPIDRYYSYFMLNCDEMIMVFALLPDQH